MNPADRRFSLAEIARDCHRIPGGASVTITSVGDGVLFGYLSMGFKSYTITFNTEEELRLLLERYAK